MVMKKGSKIRDWYTLKETSEILGVYVDEIESGIKDGQIPYEKKNNQITVPASFVERARHNRFYNNKARQDKDEISDGSIVAEKTRAIPPARGYL